MMNVREINNVYFIGIGGIGMSALARFFNDRGKRVSGYDKNETDLTKKLSEEGIFIHYDDNLNLIDKTAELVIYTPAIPTNLVELNWYKDNNYPVFKRSDVLQWITESLFSITVAGTHGKTTITTIISYLLRETGYGCNAFIGGVSVNYERNYWSSDNQVAVIEADEYDRSFLKLQPDIALITSMDPDHLDIYGTVEEMENAFKQYAKNIKSDGKLLVKYGMNLGPNFSNNNKITYSLQNDAADAYATNIIQTNGGYLFDLITPFGNNEKIELNIGGMHNVENSVAALTVGLMLGIDAVKLKAALKGFKGVKRRFEYIVKNEKTVFIDDYAHHPEELATLIISAKKLFHNKKCVIVFQPHLFTRTRDLADGFASSLDIADQVILLDIYPARELPIEGVTSEIISQKMLNPAHTILTKEGLLEFVRSSKIELLITAGAGDIDRLVNPIKEIIENK